MTRPSSHCTQSATCTSPRKVAPLSEGIITGSAPCDITQCAVDCSIHSRVLDGAALRSPSGWKKQALMPIFRRSMASHRGGEEPLEILGAHRPRIGLVADVGGGDLHQPR